MRVFNFAAGPVTLPLEVLEVSHRSKAVVACAEQAEAVLREILGVPASCKEVERRHG